MSVWAIYSEYVTRGTVATWAFLFGVVGVSAALVSAARRPVRHKIRERFSRRPRFMDIGF